MWWIGHMVTSYYLMLSLHPLMTLTLEIEIGHATNVFNAFDVRSSSFKITCRLNLLRWSNFFRNFESLQFTLGSQHVRHYAWSSFQICVGCRKLTRREDYIPITYEFDVNVIILLLMSVFEILNHIIQTCVAIVVGFNDFIEEDCNIFGVGTSMEKFKCAIIIWELSLFKRLSIIITCDDPLALWWIHKSQFPNVGFLVKQILGILKSHIEIKCVFSFVGV